MSSDSSPTVEENPHLWILGAGLAIAGSIMSTLGVNIQKYTFKTNANRPSGGEHIAYWKDPLWCLGLGLVVAGSVGDFSALGFAAQSIVAPVGGSTLVANLVFAMIWLKERISYRDMAGTTMILSGSILAVVFGNHQEVTYTLEQLLTLYRGSLFIGYGCAVLAIVIALAIVVNHCELTLRAIARKQVELDQGRSSLSNEAITSIRQDMVELDLSYAPFVKWHPFSLCTLSGTLGAQSILFAKCMAVLLRRTFEGDNQFDKLLTYLFIVSCTVTISGQIHFLAMALQRFDALYVVPVFQCAFIGISTLGGICFFKEFATFDLIQSFMFPIGLTMTLIGVYLLSQRKMSGTAARSTELVTRPDRPGFSHRSNLETRKSAEEFNDEMDGMTPLVPLLSAAWKLKRSLTSDELDFVLDPNWVEMSVKELTSREEPGGE